MSEEKQASFDEVVVADGKRFGLTSKALNSGQSQIPALLVTDVDNNQEYILTARQQDTQTGEMVNAMLQKSQNGYPSGIGQAPSELPEKVRDAMAKRFTSDFEAAKIPLAAEVMENLKEGKNDLSAPPLEERQKNAAFRRVMSGTDLDAEIAETTAETRMDTLLDELNAAKEAGDKSAEAKVMEQLKAAKTEQPELDEAAEMLGKVKNHFKRDDFEAKKAGDAIEGEQIEEGHVARLKAQRAAEQEKGAEGQSR